MQDCQPTAERMTSRSTSARLQSQPASYESSAEMNTSMPLTLRPGKINR
jgi:hypothetical protein